MSTPERAGWYDDPEDDSQLRYFDGIIWSDRSVPKRVPRAAPTPQDSDGALGQGGPGTDVFGRPGGAAPPQHQSPQHGQQTPPGWGPAQASATPTTEDGQPLAGYGARAGAYLLDALLVGILNLLLAGWAWWFFLADYWAYVWEQAMSNPGMTEVPSVDQVASLLNYQYFFIALGITLLVEAVYHVGFLVARSATPGKLLLGISVRRVDAPGRLGVGVAFMRVLLPLGLRLLWALTCLFDVIVRAADLLWPLKDKRQQALHDKIAGTQVVQGTQPRERPGAE